MIGHQDLARLFVPDHQCLQLHQDEVHHHHDLRHLFVKKGIHIEEKLRIFEVITMVKETVWQHHPRRQIKIVLLQPGLAQTDTLLSQNLDLLQLHYPCLHITDLEVLLLLHIPEAAVAIVDVAAQCLRGIILHVIIPPEVVILLHMVVVVLHLMNDQKAMLQEKAMTHVVVHLPVPGPEIIQATAVVELLSPHRPCSALPIVPQQPTLGLNASTHI